jgi:hypothetical protein
MDQSGEPFMRGQTEDTLELESQPDRRGTDYSAE